MKTIYKALFSAIVAVSSLSANAQIVHRHPAFEAVATFYCQFGAFDVQSFNAWYNYTGKYGSVALGTQDECLAQSDKLQAQFGRVERTVMFAFCDQFSQLHRVTMLTNGELKRNKVQLFLVTEECTNPIRQACLVEKGEDPKNPKNKKTEVDCIAKAQTECKAKSAKSCLESADKFNALQPKPM